MSKQKVQFGETKHPDEPETGVRANMVDVPDEKEKVDHEEHAELEARAQAKEIVVWFGDRKDDEIHKSFKVNKLHIHMLREIVDNKKLGLSYGKICNVNLLHAKLKKHF
jgi:hypothetical protein